MNRYSLGIDIGGTFTDIVLYERANGSTLSHKELTTTDAPHEGVLCGVRTLFSRCDAQFSEVSRVVHATTLFTNAVIERKGAVTGLITTRGFRDTIEMRREHKYDTYDLFIELPKPLVPRLLRMEVPERIAPDGSVELALDDAEVQKAATGVASQGANSIAVVFLHAYANPQHEQQARRAIHAHYPAIYVSLSSEVSPQIREYERTSTTAANAYIMPLADSYFDLMSRELAALGISAPLFVMLSNGGLTHIEEAKRVPIQLLESGPAAGALAGAIFGKRSKAPDVLAFDMGGTTAKIAIVEDGEPLIAHSFEASLEKRFIKGSGLPINISAIELIEIGAGGGSIAAIDALGLLKVGPRSAGSLPGPACYRRGGTNATVTDANLVLGFLDAENFAGGTMKIDKAAAQDAIEPLARQLGLSVERTAWGIHTVVNETMAAAARVHVADRGHSADRFVLLTTGGGGSLHGCDIARRLRMHRLISPPNAGVASALGLLLAPARVDRVITVAKRLNEIDWTVMEATFGELEAEALDVIDATEGTPRGTAIVRSADMRFVGQGFELNTTLPRGPYTKAAGKTIHDIFCRTYRAMFGNIPPVSELEIVNIRIAVSKKVGETRLRFESSSEKCGRALIGKRLAWSDKRSKMVMMPVYHRDALAIGKRIAGPAILQEPSTTLVLPAESRAHVDEAGNLIVDVKL